MTLNVIDMVFGMESARYIRDWMPTPFTINSFDCARRSMGVAVVDIDPYIVLPRIYVDDLDPLDCLTVLEAHLKNVSDCLDQLIRISYIGVWDLGNVVHPWDAAPPLRANLEKLDQEFGIPSSMIYEFQMDLNDKSRMISSMLAYHYSGVHTVRIQPAEKNKITMRNVSRDEFRLRCPRTANRRVVYGGRRQLIVDAMFQGATLDLSISQFLRYFTKTYTANKTHTSAMLELWSSVFGVSLDQVPDECTDDAADTFIQVLAGIKTGKFSSSKR